MDNPKNLPTEAVSNPLIEILAQHLTVGFPDKLRFSDKDYPAREVLDACADHVESALGFRPTDAQLSPLLTEMPGVTKARTNMGYTYSNVTPQTRAERARAEVASDYWTKAFYPYLAEAKQAHADREHNGNVFICRCQTPERVYEAVTAKSRARLDDQSEAIDRETEERYGPALAMTLADMTAEYERLEAARAASPWTPWLAAMSAAPWADGSDDDQSDQPVGDDGW